MYCMMQASTSTYIIIKALMCGCMLAYGDIIRRSSVYTKLPLPLILHTTVNFTAEAKQAV